MTVWTLRKNHIDIKKMSNDLNISEIFAQVLGNRKIFSRNSASLYIKPRIALMYDPFLMRDMEKAVRIILAAKNDKKKIFIYGDYDVDGVSSTVILYKAFSQFGCDVEYYIPNRKYEGYGLNINCIDAMKDRGCDIVFACDNGIAAVDEALYIKELGMELIILDHHEPAFEEDREIIPNAAAVIDCKQKKCMYPFKGLCAGGMAYKFVKALFKYSDMEIENEAELFVFAAIATVCDIVDLCDENRIFVRNGIRILNSGRKINIGVKALIKCQGLDKKVTEETLGFVIGPCINASGRLESALDAVELFIEEDFGRALAKAERLVKVNEERKRLTLEAYERVIESVENSDLKNDKIMVIYDENVDESIMGIVAGKIKEDYYKPVIVISSGDEFDKGSARSIEGYNIFESLLENKELFIKFGGHAMAAGFSIEHKNIAALRKSLNENCTLSESDLTEVIRIDRELCFEEISEKLAGELELMRPFGKGNSRAVFATRGVFVSSLRYVGANKNIIQFVFSDGNNSFKGVSFRGYEKFNKYVESNFEKSIQNKIFDGDLCDVILRLDIVYSIEINEFKGFRNVQLVIRDFRACLKN